MIRLNIGLRGKLAITQVYVFCLGLAYILYQKQRPIPDFPTLLYVTSLLLTGLAFWCIFTWRKLTGKWFDPYIVFLLAAFLFNGGQAFLETIRLNDAGFLNNKFYPEQILDTLILVFIGIFTFHLGALLSIKKEVLIVSHNKKSIPRTEVNLPQAQNRLQYLTGAMRLVGWTFLLISIVPNIIVLSDMIQTVQEDSYLALYEREAKTGIDSTPSLLSRLLIPGALFLIAGSKGRMLNLIVASFCIVAYSAILILVGYRGWGVLPLIGLAWLWDNVVKSIPRTAIVACALLVLFIIFPTIKQIRNVSPDKRDSLSDFADVFSSIENPITFLLSEMGGSMQTITYTLKLVPETRDFDKGASYIRAVITIIPNFFGELHPAVKQPLPSRWLIQTVNPWIAARGGGMGYSFIAEAYLNFGWWGALALGGIGWGFGKLVYWGNKPSHLPRMALLATFTSFFAMYARGEAIMAVRFLVWYSWLPYVLVFVFSDIFRQIDSHQIITYKR